MTPVKTNNSDKRTRFAIYARYSSEMQNELSLEAQERCCREAIVERGGTVVSVYKDGAKSGWSLDRDGFNELRKAAERGKFDALMMWKFDRLARDHDNAVVIKMLLRHEYGLKLFCVEGFSEDDGDSPYAAMMEQMLAVFAAFYSRNLSSETKRGKKHRAINGYFNGSAPPFGYDLVKTSEATQDRPAGLYINLRQAAIVRRAFRMYATGKYSDTMIAEWMNSLRYVKGLRINQKPIGKEMIRDVLRNRVYTGRVPRSDTQYSGTLGQGKQSARNRKEWFEGKHEGFISDELFDACQQAREHLIKRRRSPTVMHQYLLHDRVYCARCTVNKPEDLVDLNYGKMRPGWSSRRARGEYRCLARDRGYNACEQSYVLASTIDQQVVAILKNLEIPSGALERVEQAVRERVEHAEALKRMDEIRAIVQRVHFSWEQGFMSQQEFVEKQKTLQRELDSLRPLDYDDLMQAVDLMENFASYWEQCNTLDNPVEAQRQLITKVVDRVFVHDDNVIGITLHGDYSIILNEDSAAPDEMIERLSKVIKKGAGDVETSCTQSGSDGGRPRLCTIYIFFHHSRDGGKAKDSTQFRDTTLFYFPERTARDCSFLFSGLESGCQSLHRRGGADIIFHRLFCPFIDVQQVSA